MRAAKRLGKLTSTRATAITAEQGVNAKILAAGTIPWRTKSGKLQVLLIHRPEFDDWSWPKGRLDANETLPEAAWRETKEEVGLDVPLGIPLGIIRYRTPQGNNRKEVWYWAARVVDQKARPDNKEIDDVCWVNVERARQLLSKELDQKPLDVLEAAFDAHQLATVPFVVVRQAKATPAESWTRDEIDRPLADSGYQQAKAVARLLRAWKPTRIVTSRYTRSLETIAPYVKKHGGAVRTKKWLNKIPEEQNASLARRLRQEFKRLEPIMVCSQPSVVKQILKEIKAWIRAEKALFDPKSATKKKQFKLAPGSVLVVHRAKHCTGQIVSVERYDPLVK